MRSDDASQGGRRLRADVVVRERFGLDSSIETIQAARKQPGRWPAGPAARRGQLMTNHRPLRSTEIDAMLAKIDLEEMAFPVRPDTVVPNDIWGGGHFDWSTSRGTWAFWVTDDPALWLDRIRVRSRFPRPQDIRVQQANYTLKELGDALDALILANARHELPGYSRARVDVTANRVHVKFLASKAQPEVVSSLGEIYHCAMSHPYRAG